MCMYVHVYVSIRNNENHKQQTYEFFSEFLQM